MIQAFDWQSWSLEGGWWDHLSETLPGLAKQVGASHVWLPPISKSVSKEGYMPTQLYDLNSRYGTQASLERLLQLLSEAGLVPVADIVINHRSADAKDDEGFYNVFLDLVDHPGRSIAWDASAITREDGPGFRGRGSADSGLDYGAASDIDHSNAIVVEGLIDWLSWVRSLGFRGFRLDFAFGYSGAVAKNYIEKALEVRDVDGALVGDFVVAECWGSLDYDKATGLMQRNQDAHRQRIVDWIDAAGGMCAAYDFTLKGILQEAMEKCQYWRLVDDQGRAPGVAGLWPSRSVTWCDNHDTGRSPNQNHWPFPADKVWQGYAYILTHPGMPCLNWTDVLADKDGTLSKLVDIRRRARVRADAKLEVLCASDAIYVAQITGLESRLLVKLGPQWDMGDAAPDGRSWEVALSGEDWCVWRERAL